MLALTLIAVAPCLLGQLRGEYGVSVRTEARGSAAGADAEVAPAAGLDLSSGAFRLFGEYAPLLRLNEPYAGGPTTFLHSGALAGEWKPGPTNRVLAAARASYGTTDFLEPASPATSGPQPLQPSAPPVEPVPAGFVARTLDFSGTLGGEWLLSPRVHLSLAAGYGVSGALDPEAQAVLPLRRGPDGRVRVGLDVTPTDGLQSELWATQSAFSTGASASVISLDEQWLHRFNERTDGTVQVGAAGIRAQAPGEELRLDAVPVATAGLVHRLPARDQRFTFSLSGGAVPFVDRFAGSAYLRAEATGGVVWISREVLRLELRGGAAYNLTGGEQRGERTGVIDFTASYDLDRRPIPRWRVNTFIHGFPGLGAWSVGAGLTFREHGFL